MSYTKDQIRNDKIRADAEKLAASYPKYSGEVFKKRQLTFHGIDERDGKWKVWKREEVPSYALTSDLTYWISKDGFQGLSNRWWDICDIMTAYVLRAARTGKSYNAAPTEFERDIAAYGFDVASVRAVLQSLARHVSDIPYGKYVFNPGAVLKAANGGGGLVLAGLGLGLGGLLLASKKKR